VAPDRDHGNRPCRVHEWRVDRRDHVLLPRSRLQLSGGLGIFEYGLRHDPGGTDRDGHSDADGGAADFDSDSHADAVVGDGHAYENADRSAPDFDGDSDADAVCRDADSDAHPDADIHVGSRGDGHSDRRVGPRGSNLAPGHSDVVSPDQSVVDGQFVE
jgi:hypothetical protein